MIKIKIYIMKKYMIVYFNKQNLMENKINLVIMIH